MAELPENDRMAGPFIAMAGQTDFPGDFPLIDAPGDPAGTCVLFVRERAGDRTELALGDFTIPAANDAGFTLRLVVPSLEGDRCFVIGRQKQKRLRAHPSGGAVRTPTLEADAREAVARHQEARRDLDRALVVPVGDPPMPLQRRDLLNGGLALITSAGLSAFKGTGGKIMGFDPVTGGPLAVSPNFTVDVVAATVASRVAAQGAIWPADTQFVQTQGHAGPGDGGGALWRRVLAEPAHPGWFASADGKLWEIAATVLDPRMFGVIGQPDDFAVFADWAATTVALNLPWEIPAGTWTLNGAATIDLTTSGVCRGMIDIPKANAVCRIRFVRDAAGTVLDTTGWAALARGKNASGATAAYRNLYIGSNEVLIEREGGASTPYYKQEFIRSRSADGSFSTPLVCTYDDLGEVTVEAHEPSVPTEVKGLRIIRSGPAPGALIPVGSIAVMRDAVTFDNLEVINPNPAVPLSVVVDIGYCADVTFNRPRIRGADDVANGVGYGLLFATTIGCVVNDPDIQDCREAISGRHNVDLTVNRGTCSWLVDDHWGDRMVVRDTVIRCKTGGSAVQYAGNDILLDNISVVNGRAVLAVRGDTPHLGGAVTVRKPTIYSRGETGGAYYLFTLSSPDGPPAPITPYTNKPALPDTVTLDSVTLDVDTASVFLAYLGLISAPHVNWGRVSIIGDWSVKATGSLIGVLLLKNATYQQDRATEIRVDTPLNFGTGTIAYVIALDADATRGAVVKVDNVSGGNLRYSPFGVSLMRVTGGAIGSVENDDGSEAAGATRSLFSRVQMTGGLVRATIANIAFLSCQFTGPYTEFPPDTTATMIGNLRTTSADALPTDISSNVVSPYL